MTSSTWTQGEIENQFGECGTLKDVISRIETDFSLKGEVICEIRVNGLILDEDDEVKFGESPLHEIVDLAVKSNKPDLLIGEALRSAYAFIPEIEDSCLETAERFRGADLHLSQAAFTACLEGCQWMVETLMHARGAASGLGRPMAQAERWFESERIITTAIRELSAAYIKKDYVLVADLLEYEVTGALAIWKTVLEAQFEA